MDHAKVDAFVRKKLKQSRDLYEAYSDKDRFSIGKDASMYGPTTTIRKWKKNLPESEREYSSWI